MRKPHSYHLVLTGIFNQNTASGAAKQRSLQKERMVAAEIPNEKNYFENFGITNKILKLAKPDAIVMHPGPVNRGIEVDSSVADGPQSVILKQVTNGIAVRMAAMEVLAEAL